MRMILHFPRASWPKLVLWLLGATVLAHTASAQESKPPAQKPPAAKPVAAQPQAPASQVPPKEEPDDAARPHRVKYRRTSATAVDLGVGLWAWPLPLDWDEDGDLDLVVSCPDVPYRGIYFFENPGGGKLPVFKPPVFVAPALPNATLSVINGQARILVPGQELVDFRANQFSKHETIYPQSNIHANGVRANQWRYVDYDADGLLDLVVGVGDWTDYGWDNAYDAQGRWTNGPLHGYVYLLRNTGTPTESKYADAVKIEADGAPVDVYGMPSPNFADFDGDGDLDLLCGEFLDGFTYFQNTGSRSEPRLAAGQVLTSGGQRLHMDLQMIVPVALDWDADGDVDLVCGNSAGYIAWMENQDGQAPPSWAAPIYLQADGAPIRIQAGPNGSIQGPCEAKWGYTTLNVADWDHDGLLDLVVNSIWGRVEWYRNVGTKTVPKLAAAQSVRVDWPRDMEVPKPAWIWWQPQPQELVTQWRTTPVVIDLDQDGLNDLVMLDHEGYLSFFHRKRVDDQLWLEPGRRIFTDPAARPLQLSSFAAGKSGRRKFCFADWDGDGKLDLLINSRSINLLRNVSTPQRPWSFLDVGPLDERRLAGHTTSPTIVDWNHDKKPDLLIGAEDGHFYYQPNTWRDPTRHETEDLILEVLDVEIATLDNGQQSFGNRNYVWYDVPEQLRGWQFTRTSGGVPAFVLVQAKREVEVQMATSRARNGVKLDGWNQVEGLEFGYTDRDRARMDVFRCRLRAGDRITIPQGNWSGGLLLLPPAANKPKPAEGE